MVSEKAINRLRTEPWSMGTVLEKAALGFSHLKKLLMFFCFEQYLLCASSALGNTQSEDGV